MRSFPRLQVLVVALTIASLAFPARFGLRAQEAAVGDSEEGGVKRKTSALGVRQDHVKRMMQDLEQKFVDLARTLEKTEPAQAKRLIQALQQSKETLIENRMGKIAGALNDAQFDSATAEQKRVVADLKKLIAVLLEDENDRDRIQAEIDRLERWKKEINDLIEEETNNRRDSEKVSDKEKAQADLAAQIAKVEDLIKRQQQVLDKTAKARAEGIQALGPVAGEQAKLRGETEKLAKEIGKPRAEESDSEKAEPKPGEGKPGEGKPGEGKPGEGKPGEGKPGEGKPGEGKPGEGKPGEGKPGEGKPGEGKPGEGKPGEGKPGEGQSGEGQSGEGQAGGESQAGEKNPNGAEPGQKPLEEAANKQKSAEQKLGEGKGKAAEGDEKAAIDELNKALAELKKEQARIASLPPEPGEELAKKQDETGEKTNKLGEEMKQSEAGGGQGGKPGEPGEGGEGEPSPGSEKVQEAKEEMKQASKDLRKKDPKEASKKQKKAAKDLKQARDEIEERLAQLRKEMQLEKLAALEARFQQMLDLQKPLTIATAELDKARGAANPPGKLTRTQRLALKKSAEDERAIAELAQKALDIIIEDGTSVVFAHVTGQLRDDLRGVGVLLDDEGTGPYVQDQQKEIERTLAELIEALQKAQKQEEESEGEGEGEGEQGEDNEPLLPNSAELKLLKAAQLRVNRRTTSFDTVRPAELTPVLKTEVRNIAQRQEEVVQMTEEMSERR